MNFPWVESLCDLTQHQFVIPNLSCDITHSLLAQKSGSASESIIFHRFGSQAATTRVKGQRVSAPNPSRTFRQLVAVNSSPYKVWAAMWRGLYMRVTVWVCLSRSLCGNLQTHLARHKQQWPGKIVEIPPTYQGIWGFGLTIHTDTHTDNERQRCGKQERYRVRVKLCRPHRHRYQWVIPADTHWCWH